MIPLLKFLWILLPTFLCGLLFGAFLHEQKQLTGTACTVILLMVLLGIITTFIAS